MDHIGEKEKKSFSEETRTVFVVQQNYCVYSSINGTLSKVCLPSFFFFFCFKTPITQTHPFMPPHLTATHPRCIHSSEEAKSRFQEFTSPDGMSEPSALVMDGGRVPKSYFDSSTSAGWQHLTNAVANSERCHSVERECYRGRGSTPLFSG